MDELQKGEILIYQSESGNTKIDVYLEDGTVWLPQSLISELYQTTPQNIIMHTRNIYKDGELVQTSGGLCQIRTRANRRRVRICSLCEVVTAPSLGWLPIRMIKASVV